MRIYHFLGLCGLVALSWWAYAPGQTGAFLFDDFKNLDILGTYGAVNRLQTFLLYVTSGDADPVGRPIALLSFLLDANDWPADPAPFKHTNILLHLLNGVLLSWVLLQLGRQLNLSESSAASGAILGALLWTLHPLWTSTTLYVVQREAMLPATFSLIGILLWITGREKLAAKQCHGYWYLLAGAGACTLLATLSKGNGILLPSLILVLEWTILDRTALQRMSRPRIFRGLRVLLLGLPAAIVMTWLGAVFCKGVIRAFIPGSISPWQRLISEPRAILDYLLQLFVPRGSIGGLLNDDFLPSIDLLHPWTTLPSIAAVVLLITIAIRLRKSYPVIACSILFFFVGHVLESTVAPLELYFEHRNYLPALLLFWPLGLWLTNTVHSLPRLRLAVTIALPCLLAVLTHSRAVVWGEPYIQAMLFAEASPHSVRAQTLAAYYHLGNGHPLLAVYSFRKTLHEFPDEAVVGLHLIEAECALGSLEEASQDMALDSVRNNFNQTGIVHYWMIKHMDLAISGKCRNFDLGFMERMLQAIRDNPHFASEPTLRRDVEHMEGRFALTRKDGESAIEHFNRALTQDPTLGEALEEAALLGSAQFPKLGLQHLAYFDSLPPTTQAPSPGMVRIHAHLLEKLDYQASQRRELQMQLQQEAALFEHLPQQKQHPTPPVIQSR